MDRLQLTALLERHHAAAYTWALHCCNGDPDEAMDLLQGVYVTVLEGKAPFQGRSSFRTWLFALIRKAAWTARRRLLLRWRKACQEWEQPQAVPPDADRFLLRSELRRRVAALVATLSERQRQVVYLVFYHDLTVEEAAGVMGISIGSARRHYHRGKQRLRNQIETEGTEYEWAIGG